MQTNHFCLRPARHFSGGFTGLLYGRPEYRRIAIHFLTDVISRKTPQFLTCEDLALHFISQKDFLKNFS
jgi:hypothetical protein